MTTTLSSVQRAFGIPLHPSVDHVAWTCFNAEFERRYRRYRGIEFQTLFRRIMRFAHGAEFAEVRPHGSYGDRKCDGYLRTTRTVFACYAPKEMKIPVAKRKFRSDHCGALRHWKLLMSAWVVVHNDEDGLPADLHQALQELQQKDADVTVDDWNIEEIRPLVQRLNRDALTEMFGAQPSLRDLVELSSDDIKSVVDDLAALIEHAGPGPEDTDVRPVPMQKLLFNRLNVSTQDLLRLGQSRSPLVHKHFEGHTDPQLAGVIAKRFSARYRELRDEQLGPNEIFQELEVFAGYFGGSSRRQVAALALLAYLFEACHIFERPPDAEAPTDAAPDKDPVTGALSAGSRGVDSDAADRTQARVEGLG